MTKKPIIIVLVVLIAGVAGLFASGIVGGKDATGKKHKVEPVALSEPFTINLSDPDSAAFLRVGIAVQLGAMDDEHYKGYAGGGGHGGPTEAPGAIAVAKYPKFRDGIIRVASRFSSATLLTTEGKQQFKDELLTEFAAIAEQDLAEAKSTLEDPKSIGMNAPYDVIDVGFTEFVVQP